MGKLFRGPITELKKEKKKGKYSWSFQMVPQLTTQLYQLILGDFLEKHLKKMVKFIETKSDVEILAIGIGHDVSRYYDKAIKITDVHELGDVMVSQLSGLFENKKKLH